MYPDIVSGPDVGGNPAPFGGPYRYRSVSERYFAVYGAHTFGFERPECRGGRYDSAYRTVRYRTCVDAHRQPFAVGTGDDAVDNVVVGRYDQRGDRCGNDGFDAVGDVQDFVRADSPQVSGDQAFAAFYPAGFGGMDDGSGVVAGGDCVRGGRASVCEEQCCGQRKNRFHGVRRCLVRFSG